MEHAPCWRPPDHQEDPGERLLAYFGLGAEVAIFPGDSRFRAPGVVRAEPLVGGSAPT